MLLSVAGGETHGGVYCCTARREKYELAKGIWPEGRGLGAKTWGKVLAGAGSAMERLEGQRALPSVMILLEFPSLEQAKAWYNDPEYAHMIHLRQTGADAEIIVVDGF